MASGHQRVKVLVLKAFTYWAPGITTIEIPSMIKYYNVKNHVMPGMRIKAF